MRTKKEIKTGLKKLREVNATMRSELAMNFNIRAKIDLPQKGKMFNGTVKLNLLDVIEDMERIIRATEICTLKWVLKEGGGLNTRRWAFKSKDGNKAVGGSRTLQIEKGATELISGINKQRTRKIKVKNIDTLCDFGCLGLWTPRQITEGFYNGFKDD